MSAGRPVFDASNAGQPREPVVPPPSEAVNPPIVTPLDGTAAMVDPPAQRKADKAAETISDDVCGTTDSQAIISTAQTVRKTCIVKLDGCHYTIGTNVTRLEYYAHLLAVELINLPCQLRYFSSSYCHYFFYFCG